MDSFLLGGLPVLSLICCSGWWWGVCSSDVMEEVGESRPQVMDFRLVLMRLLMIFSGWGMFPCYMDNMHFGSESYPCWSGYLVEGGIAVGGGRGERLYRMLPAYMLCDVD